MFQSQRHGQVIAYWPRKHSQSSELFLCKAVVILTPSGMNYKPEMECTPVNQAWKTQASDLDLNMKNLRQSGHEKLRPRQGRTHPPLLPRARGKWIWVQGQPGTKQGHNTGRVRHTFNLSHTFWWRATKGH